MHSQIKNMNNQNIWYCDNIDLYKVLCPPKLKSYSKTNNSNFGQGDLIYFEKESAQQIYLIQKGKVKIATYDDDGNELVKAILTKGKLFGEMIILGEEKRKDFAISLTKKTIICPVNIDKMYSLMRSNKFFSAYIYKVIGLRIRKIEKRLEMILFKDASTRVKEFISELASEFGTKENSTILINHPYTQNDIASLIGLRRETVNFLLQQFKAKEQLEYRRYQIKIHCQYWQKQLKLEPSHKSV